MRDHDSAELAFKLRTLVYAGFVAFVTIAACLLLGVPIEIALPAAIGLALVVYFGALTIAEKAGAAGARIFTPSGSSTPSVREYSLAESMVVSGRLNEAARAYELHAEEFPDDPEPPTRLARLLRDKLARFEDAAVWFKRALAVDGISAHTEIALLRELSELYTHKLREPAKALPYLARLADKYPRNTAAQWARAEVREIKQALRSKGSNG